MESPSPISIGPFDVLSYIFEICGEEDYRTTMKIAVVSCHWRDIVLATPRAWAFVDIKTCRDDQAVELYLQRSGKQPLHICLPALRSFSLLTNVTGRLQCLSIHAVHEKIIEKAVFPNVTHLRIYGQGFATPVSSLSSSRFPALRHLLSQNRWVPAVDDVALPPLQSLSQVIGTGYYWLRVLTDCKDTLTSLKRYVATRYRYAGFSRLDVRLPRLQCLEVEYSKANEIYLWPLELKTPVLTTFIEMKCPLGSPPLQLDFENIQCIRIDRIPPLDALPNLRELQLEGRHMLVGKVLTRILEDPVLCPELTLIDPGEDEMENMEQKVTEINKTRPNPIHLTSMLRESDPPGVILRSCGPGCHVNDTPV